MNTNQIEVSPTGNRNFDREVLLSEESSLNSPNKISVALSFWYSWKEKAQSNILLEDGKTLKCFVDFDQEERQPSNVWIRTEENTDILRTIKTLEIETKLFNVGYKFKSSILQFEENENGMLLVVELPMEIQIHRPTGVFPKNISGLNLQINLSFENSVIQVAAVAISPNSIRVRSKQKLNSSCSLQIGENKFNCSVTPQKNDEAVIGIKFKDSIEVSTFFKFYANLVFGGLKLRSECNPEEVAKLYKETNYTAKFVSRDEVCDGVGALIGVWHDIDFEKWKSIDFVAHDRYGILSGASSVTLSFISEGKEIWAFHQLCARKDPDLLELSGALYQWRAEYLSALNQDLYVMGWFDSNSRWLERIYIRFAADSNKNEYLIPVKVTKYKVEHRVKKSGVTKDKLGKCTRYFYDQGGVFGGTNPRLLNASCALDSVINIGKDSSEKIAIEAAEALAARSGNNFFEITSLYQNDAFSNYEKVESVDRLFMFPKESMAMFLTSVEHVLATTIKRKEHYARNRGKIS